MWELDTEFKLYGKFHSVPRVAVEGCGIIVSIDETTLHRERKASTPIGVRFKYNEEFKRTWSWCSN